METAAVLGFAAIAFTLVLVPGPDWAYVLAAGARDHVVLPAVAGLMAGYGLITTALVVGIGPLVTAVPMVLVVLTVAGAVYLLHLGVRTLRSSPQVEAARGQGSLAASPGGYVARGVAVSGLNPKGVLLFLSILPQFTDGTGGWPLPAQFAALGGVFMLLAALLYLPLGFTAHRVLGSRPKISLLTTRIAGAAMIVVGLGLLAERIMDIISRGS